jgi:parvulin-like peptidyl-prolyl isomerase
MYSDDKNKHHDCDLQWFYADVMVKPFSDEVIKHKKDDVFIVETEFGFHVVKSLENPVKDKQVIHFVSLAKKKKKEVH